jgi:hypothetical protein
MEQRTAFSRYLSFRPGEGVRPTLECHLRASQLFILSRPARSVHRECVGGKPNTGISSMEHSSLSTNMKLQFITAAISLLTGIGVGILAVHLLTGMSQGLQGQWAQYMRF